MLLLLLRFSMGRTIPVITASARGRQGSTRMTLKNTEARYWSLVDKRGPNECWVWRGYRHKQGYGRFKWRGQNRLAHRLSVQFTTGKEIPWQVHALHRCDNPPCVNPEHIFLGNHRANMADMRRKGRHAHGERSGLAVLTE